MTWILQAQLLSRSPTIARTYPGVRLRGEFSGPVTLQGTLDSLDLTAQLTGEPGVLGVDGHFRSRAAGAGQLGRADDGAYRSPGVVRRRRRFRRPICRSGWTPTCAAIRWRCLDGPASGTLARVRCGRLRLDTARFVGRFGGRASPDRFAQRGCAGLAH